MKAPPALDFIGDIHGHYDKLVTLLRELGYEKRGAAYQHPEGRRIVFLGDYIDRGPRIRDTLNLVKMMCDTGNAWAVMGNHEWNAIGYATRDGEGGYVRPHNEKHREDHRETLVQFAAHPREWAGWLEWMKRLPLYLDFGGVRAVHACWDVERKGVLAGRALTENGFFRDCTRKGAPEFAALENMLRGPELHVPPALVPGERHRYLPPRFRARWWEIVAGMDLGELMMPVPLRVGLPLAPEQAENLPNYPADEVPVLVGHYGFPAQAPRVPLANNIACLDFSGGYGANPLCAYRWDGEAVLKAEKFVTAAKAPCGNLLTEAGWR